MKKKLIRRLCAALFACSLFTASAQNEGGVNAQSAEPVEQILPDGQTALEADDVESAPVNEVIESRYARKSAQEIKAENLKENDSAGGAVTIIAMCIVVGALAILSILFLIFGKISASLMAKKKAKATGKGADSSTAAEEDHETGEVIAAIAAALAEHFGHGHDMEDTILTIRRMKRSYSPWNSKIYNMRHTPDLTHNLRH